MTLTETTANKLIQLIKDRHLNPGDKLPTEVDLSQQLDVGRNTLREAQKILVSRNILSASPLYMTKKDLQRTCCRSELCSSLELPLWLHKTVPKMT